MRQGGRFSLFKRTPVSTEAARRERLIKTVQKKPSIYRRLKGWGLAGTVIGALFASQGPAVRQQYAASRESLRRGAEVALNSEMSLADRAKVTVGLKKPAQVVVGKGWKTYRDNQGRLHIGKPEVALQTAKNYRPQVQFTPSSAKSAGKGALVGAGVGATVGLAGYLRRRNKVKRAEKELAKTP